jgi:diguanylate cyclase (GGDEF)-like protein
MSAQYVVRILVVDDESSVRDAYREVLENTVSSASSSTIERLRAKVLGGVEERRRMPGVHSSPIRFELVLCDGAEAAVKSVRAANAAKRPFAVAFLDMRMPPGPDGLWAAKMIRALSPKTEIVFCTAYSDVDPDAIAQQVPPADKLFYIEKPFHPFEVRQLATALGSKWRAESSLMRLAYFDALTGLPNRQSFRSRLAAALDTSRNTECAAAVLYIDLDDFKRINDTLGHDAGDELLCVVSERLRVSLRADDEVARSNSSDPSAELARLGGDEFVVVINDIGGQADAGVVAQRIIRSLTKPIQIGGHDVLITPSIGIAIYPADGETADDLCRHADIAMYAAKRSGPAQFEFYDATMSAGALQRLTLETKLRGALAAAEFSLHYQPQFDLQSGLISGMEALIRWKNSELGSVPPSEFIPILEAMGLILPVGEWVLRTACAQQREWCAEGLPSIRMAVNVSAVQFTDAQFPMLVAKVLEETRIDPTALELEITESTVMHDEARSIAMMEQLKRLGVTLAIDDFGTGYSSLGRLRELPVDRLKLDRSFVSHIVTRGSDRTIAEAIVSMAKTLHLDVVAEGVEEFPQLLLLQEQKCQSAQGYLFSRPLPAAEARQFLERLRESSDGTRTQRLRRLVI